MQWCEGDYFLEVWFEVFGNMEWEDVGVEMLVVGCYNS